MEAHSSVEQLYVAEYGRVLAIARRLLPEVQAEEVAEGVFLEYRRRLGTLAPAAPAWLHATVAQRALRVARAAEGAPSHPAPDALARLPERSATVLALYYSGLRYAEVAAALGVRVTAVAGLLARAEEALYRLHPAPDAAAAS